jgi:hypothetical protein
MHAFPGSTFRDEGQQHQLPEKWRLCQWKTARGMHACISREHFSRRGPAAPATGEVETVGDRYPLGPLKK